MTKIRPSPLSGAVLGALAVLVFFSVPLDAQWARVFGGPASDVAGFARPTSDGGIIASGYTSSWGAGGEDLWVLKLDASGTVLWQRAYGGTADDRAYVVQEAPAGGYIVLGWTESFGSGGRDAWILRLDASGNILWQRAYGGAGFDQGDDIRATPDGGWIAACFTISAGSGEEDFWILKLDASGAVQWQRSIGGPGSDLVEHVETSGDGGYLVTGFTRSFGFGRYDIWILKLSASGDVLWQRVLGGPGDDVPEYLEKTADGGFVVAGATDSFGAGGIDILLLKLDASGVLRWQRTYGGTGTDYPEAVRQTSDGGFVIGGHTDSFGAGGRDLWVVRLDAAGAVLWQRTYGGGGDDFAYSLQPASSGSGFIAAGSSRSFGSGLENAVILRLASDGRIAPSCSLGASSGATMGVPIFNAVAAASVPIDPGLAARPSSAVPLATGAAGSTLCQSPLYTLRISASPGGTTEPSPGTSLREFMETVPVSAVPASGYFFDRWSGDVPDSLRLSNPVTMTMDGDKTLQADFRARTLPPAGLEGKRVRTGAPPRSAYADILAWEPDPANPAVASFRVYEVGDATRTLLAELPAQVLTFLRWGIHGNAPRTYAVTTVDAGGFESEAASVEVTAAPRR